MSSGGQIIGGVVGAVVGYFVAGPGGALQGAALGAGIGGYLDPPKGPTVSGPRLSDLSVQTSTYGAFVPRVYGTVAVHGNLLWLENNKLKETVRKEEQSGGKGGGSSTTVRTYTYSATFALAICQGPIAGVRRIWCGDKLLYNAGSNNLETVVASNRNARGWRLYLGTDDQMPDSRYQSDVGVNNASAFRGIAYLVFEDFELADYSNTLQVAQFKVEVVNDAVDSVTNIYDAADTNITSNSSLLISGRSGEVATVRAWESSDVLPGFVSVHRTSGIRQEKLGVTASGAVIISGPVLACGNLDYAVIKNGDIHTNVGVFQLGLTLASGLSCFYSGDRLAVLWLSGTDSRVIHLFTVGQVINDHYTNSDRSYIAICLSGDRLYAITETHIVVFSAEDLTEISAVAYSSSYSMVGAVPYIAYYEGLLWLLPYNNGILQAFSADTGEKLYEIDSPDLEPPVFFGAGQPGSIVDGVLYRQSGTAPGATIQAFKILDAQSGTTPIASVIEAEVGLSGLIESADVNTSLLTSELRGYRVAGGTIRAAIEPLQGAFPFDVVPSGYQIKCVPRGQSSVVSIPWEVLGAADGEVAGDILQQAREMDTQLPARTNVKYLDAEREYADSEQYSERINTPAINRVDREMPLVITADEAAGVAEVLQNLAWLERNDLSFSLPPVYLQLEASDVVTLTLPDASYEVRLTEVNYSPSGMMECKAKPSRAALYAPNASGGEAPGPDGEVPLSGDSLFIPMDIPVVDETFQNSAGFIGVMTGYTDSWPGALAIRSADNGQTWTDIQGYAAKASVGTCLTALPASNCTLIDARSLSMSPISGSWNSITRDQMLSGQHYAAYGQDGRWEIVRYQSADLQADGTYLLSGFIRGERGTEWATGLHQVGDWFIPLDDPDLAFIGSAVEAISVPFTYRGVTSGSSYADAADVPFTYLGVNLECLSPVYPNGSRDGSGNFTGSFTRRSRVTGTWWTTGVPTPLGEDTEAYEVDVMSGSTVLRTISVTSPTFAYSAADQATDFGAPQSSITFRIYQLSAVVGRGYPLEVTL